MFSNDDSLSESLTILRESLDQIEGEVSLRTFEPSLDKFVNDEESIKAEELLKESTVTLSSIAVPSPLVLPEGSLRKVYAVDASSIILGECGKGVVFAVRGVIVRYDPWSQKSSIVKSIESPCYVSKDNSKQLYNTLRKRLLGLSEVKKAPDLTKMVDRVRNIYERYLQLETAKKYKDSILLFDGSLTGRTIDTPASLLRNILHVASSGNSDVVAFSKKTRLVTKWGERIIDLLDNQTGFPVIIPLRGMIQANDKHRFLGDVYVAKLSRMPISFRIDVYSKRSHSQALADLLHSVYLESGYPKPLIEAHVYSYFNAFDCLAYQALLAKRGIMMRHEFDVRRILFGVYGGRA